MNCSFAAVGSTDGSPVGTLPGAMDWRWLLDSKGSPAAETRVLLMITDVVLNQQAGDRITVYDGSSTTSEQLAEFDGTTTRLFPDWVRVRRSSSSLLLFSLQFFCATSTHSLWSVCVAHHGLNQMAQWQKLQAGTPVRCAISNSRRLTCSHPPAGHIFRSKYASAAHDHHETKRLGWCLS